MPMSKGYLITITGITSSGKTTAANFLQQIINKELVGNKKPFKKPFILLHLDDFLDGMPHKYRLNELERKKSSKDVSPELVLMFRGVFKSVQNFLDLGLNVIFEGAYGNLLHQFILDTFPKLKTPLTKQYLGKATKELIEDSYYKTYHVRLNRSLKSLKENEIKRKNVAGSAEAQWQDPDYQKLNNKDFDFVLKVDGLTPAEVVATIFKDYRSKL